MSSSSIYLSRRSVYAITQTLFISQKNAKTQLISIFNCLLDVAVTCITAFSLTYYNIHYLIFKIFDECNYKELIMYPPLTIDSAWQADIRDFLPVGTSLGYGNECFKEPGSSTNPFKLYS